MKKAELLSAGLRALRWLADVQRSSAPQTYFAPIGSNGFFERGGTKATLDQQPVEAAAMVSACLAARRATGDLGWVLEARRALGWFLGENHLRCSLYDRTTGGCRDGLHADRPNENQGAESTLSFLTAVTEVRNLLPVLAAPEAIAATRVRT
jgi:hypothetical protein